VRRPRRAKPPACRLLDVIRVVLVQDETERRRPRQSSLNFEEVLAAFEHARDQHVLGGPATDVELWQLERTLGAPLPTQFRSFLSRLGGGLYFSGHEIFGTRRVMVHDIELVPDILSLRLALAAQGAALPPLTIPFHRARGRVHCLKLAPEERGRIVSIPEAPAAPNLESFLETVVMPRVARP
jgi:hypothetical protein